MSMRSRSVRFAAVAVLSIAAAACTKTLDTDGLEGELKSQIEQQIPGAIASVDCPADVGGRDRRHVRVHRRRMKSGATFTITVTQRDDQGNVDWEVTDASAAA